MTDKVKTLRSARSYGPRTRDGFIHRSWMKSEGLPDDVFGGRSVIGICSTWSELTPCNAGLRDIEGRLKAWQRIIPAPAFTRGYYQLYIQHVLQADRDCDLDFIVGASGSVVERESH